ncbi:chromate transporter [uncultured Veillonella sp.]|uniref:chromate transporter n=1 Tax=uncultured Veillonella sp. TaxID=159268 RepID=UPI00259AAD1B|nr:chromate transporter [uncultured Veillonella sp.]
MEVKKNKHGIVEPTLSKQDEAVLTPPKRDAHFFWTLFKSTFIISAFTVGGGFVIIPLLKAKYVDEYHWINDKDTLDMVAIAQSMPGIVATNSAIILGYRMAGYLGTLVALLATVLPPLITLSIISYCYDYFIQNKIIAYMLRGMQCGATALILNVGIDLAVKQCKKKLALPLLILLVTFIGNAFFQLNIMTLIVLDGLVGFFFMRAAKYN